MIKLGSKVKCKVTGFEGTATKRIESLYGTPQVFVQGYDNTYRRDEWIDEPQLTCVEAKSASLSVIGERA